MNIHSKIVTAAASLGVLAAFAVLPVYAETSATVSGSVNAVVPAVSGGVSASAGGKSSAAGLNAKGSARANSAANAQQRMQNMENRGTTMIDARIDALNKLSTRLQDLKNVSVSEKATLSAGIQTELGDMTSLKSTIAADTSTSSMKADVQSITKAYRIYALIVPQASILAASDRVTTIVGLMNTLGTKLQARLSASAGLSNLATLQADLADFNAQVSDASTQASAASTEVASLQPDNGVASVLSSNTAALKDARSKIQAAAKDLQTARQDAQSIIQGVKVSASASASASSSVQ